MAALVSLGGVGSALRRAEPNLGEMGHFCPPKMGWEDLMGREEGSGCPQTCLTI